MFDTQKLTTPGLAETNLRLAFGIIAAITVTSCGSQDNMDTSIGDLPTSLSATAPVTSHQFLWQADGSSPTRGQASIYNWPRLTGVELQRVT